MKRYLLLASVAGCLLNAGNAWADDPLVTSATFNVKAQINTSVSVSNISNMDFKTIFTNHQENWSTESWTKLVTMGTDGTITPDSADVVQVGTGTPAKIGYSVVNPSKILRLECLNVEAGTDYCIVGTSDNVKFAIKDFSFASTDTTYGAVSPASGQQGDTISSVSSGSDLIGASLYVKLTGERGEDNTAASVNEATFRLTLDY